MMYDYKEIMDDVFFYNEKFTVIKGFVDIIEDTHSLVKIFLFKKLTNDNIFPVLGQAHIDHIIEDLKEFECDVEREGEYEIRAILRHNNSEFDNEGHCTSPSWWEIEHIEYDFIQSFEQRERQEKLNQLLDKDIDIFNLFI